MRRIRTAAGILLMGLCLWGCGESNVREGTDTETEPRAAIEIQKDGSILETMQEEFGAAYYDEEELKNMILSEVAEFNSSSDSGEISVEKIENKDGVLTVRMKYPSDDAYTAFNTDDYNSSTLFCGTVAEAYNEGYSLDITMTDPDGNTTIGREELLSMGEGKLVITEQPVHIKLPGKIMYVGENVTFDSKDEAYMQADENGDSMGRYYVIYQ